jgi:hypothetical protein
MEQNVIDYAKLVDEAMHVIVHRVLQMIALEGLPGNHHFFISFLTAHPGVKISQSLASKYPTEMTIVLQYQFYDLKTDPHGFSVVLSFNGVREEIYIPFIAITTFADPSVQFGLQFRDNELLNRDYLESDALEEASSRKKSNAKKGAASDKQKDAASNVVAFDKFKKK